MNNLMNKMLAVNFNSKEDNRSFCSVKVRLYLLRCHIFDLETYKNANLVCTWYMQSVYQSYTRFSSYIHIFLVYSRDIAVISHIPGIYASLPIVVQRRINKLHGGARRKYLVLGYHTIVT